MESLDKMNKMERPSACCLCIPIKIGTYILGCLLFLGMIGGLSSLFNSKTMFVGIVNLLIYGYPTVRFVQMALKDEKDTREAFAEAYKLLTYIGIVLGSVAVVISMVVMIWAGVNAQGAFIPMICSCVGLAIFWVVDVLVALHFVRVTEAYSEDDSYSKV